MDRLKLGSLFDGSGGFPLGGLLAGVTPVWASEIEPFPIRVTTKRLPGMRHLGDVSSINGADIEPVDIITFGSPCTDMSIAGKRAGLDGAQSSLFYQAIRIIKEMRCATNGRYPRWVCWENVVGAFSSNKGFDFKAVLDAVIGIAEPGASVPMPEKNRWPRADVYMGDGWSVAYRTFDAQHWGIPQRRRRVYLVGDLAGWCARQVLFESEGLSGYSAEGFRAWQRAARNPAAGLGAAGGICLNDQGGSYMDVSIDVSGTLRAQMDGHPPCIVEPKAASMGGNNHPFVCYGIGRNAFNQGKAARFAPSISVQIQPALVANGPGAVHDGYTVRRLTPTECARLQGFPDFWCSRLDTPEPTEADIAFWAEVWETHRRITGTVTKPKTRNQIVKWLQSPHSDSAEYKMWGNGVALPNVFFVLAGIVWSTQEWPG